VRVRALNPRLIFVSISGFGQDGPAASNISCTLGHGSRSGLLNGAASASVIRLQIAVSVEGL
jgi:crotonobetainyl-CoA:carnitine CoA-transferase CaiB-like acyl-CoA transferase